MVTTRMDAVLRRLRNAVVRQDASDGELLEAFVSTKDEAAFEALVRRHGPMVFSVCRRVVGNHHDAEDAFQATFLVLARRASCVKPRERVANWLHGVAYRTSLDARKMAARRREKQVTEMPEPALADQRDWHKLQPVLDQELNGLPENYRLPILLCDLEGKTIKEAMQQLGWPQGTLAGRLTRGRKLLAQRLANRGVMLSGGALAAIVSENVVSACVPTSLMSSTVKTAAMIAAGKATVAGVVPAKVAALMEGVMMNMMLTKLSKAVVAGLVVLCLCGLGVGGYQSLTAQESKTTTTTTITTTTVTTKAPKHGIEELQGKWVCGGETMVIEGNKWWSSNSGTPNSGTLQLVAVQGDVLHVDLSVTEGVPKGKTAPCIFRRDGNNLHVCNSFVGGVGYGPRPTEFKSVGSNIYMAYKRQEATKHGIEELQGKWVCGAETMVIEGDKWSTSNGDNSGRLKLVAVTGDVLSVDLIVTEGVEKGNTAPCIFRLEGNILHCCNSWSAGVGFGPRPTEFKSAGINIHMAWQRQPAQKAAAKPNMEKLQGTWKVIETNGSGDGRVKTITFSGNRYSFDSDVPIFTGNFQFVNLTGDPKSFDLTNDGGGTAYAIFRIEGDTLYYAGHGDPKARPGDFTTSFGDGRYGHVCKRVKATESAQEKAPPPGTYFVVLRVTVIEEQASEIEGPTQTLTDGIEQRLAGWMHRTTYVLPAIPSKFVRGKRKFDVEIRLAGKAGESTLHLSERDIQLPWTGDAPYGAACQRYSIEQEGETLRVHSGWVFR